MTIYEKLLTDITVKWTVRQPHGVHPRDLVMKEMNKEEEKPVYLDNVDVLNKTCDVIHRCIYTIKNKEIVVARSVRYRMVGLTPAEVEEYKKQPGVTESELEYFNLVKLFKECNRDGVYRCIEDKSLRYYITVDRDDVEFDEIMCKRLFDAAVRNEEIFRHNKEEKERRAYKEKIRLRLLENKSFLLRDAVLMTA